ncbi:hypothetical protein ACN28S_64160 [Cystobacter fuscus]
MRELGEDDGDAPRIAVVSLHSARGLRYNAWRPSAVVQEQSCPPWGVNWIRAPSEVLTVDKDILSLEAMRVRAQDRPMPGRPPPPSRTSR